MTDSPKATKVKADATTADEQPVEASESKTSTAKRTFVGIHRGYRAHENELRGTAFEVALVSGGFAIAGPPGAAIAGGIVIAGRLVEGRRSNAALAVKDESN